MSTGGPVDIPRRRPGPSQRQHEVWAPAFAGEPLPPELDPEREMVGDAEGQLLQGQVRHDLAAEIEIAALAIGEAQIGLALDRLEPGDLIEEAVEIRPVRFAEDGPGQAGMV